MCHGRFPVVLVSLGLLCALCGCGGGDKLGRHAVSGKVSVDGTSLEQGNVSFEPMEQGKTSSGAVIMGGKYSIDRDKGLPAGKYRVVINAPVPGTGGRPAPDAMPGDPLPVPKELIPPDWNVNSKQTIEVKEKGPFDFDFNISTKK